MVIRSKTALLTQFILYTSVSFIFVFALSYFLRNFLFQSLFEQNSQLNLSQFMNLFSIYIAIYIFWDVVLFFTIIPLCNIIFAKIIHVNVGKIFGITILATIFAFIIWHVSMFLYFKYANPFHLTESTDLLNYLLYMSEYYPETAIELNLEELSPILNILADILFGVYWIFIFTPDPTFLNYIFGYLILKSFASDFPFTLTSIGYNIFKVEIIFIFLIYLGIFIGLFFAFIKGTECETRFDYQQIYSKKAKKKSEELFGKREQTTKEITVKKTQISLDTD